MNMKKSTAAANLDAYVRALEGWQRERVGALREVVRGVPSLEEEIKWGNLEVVL